MLNSWCGQGRLAKDVELRYTATNIPVASFAIACDRDYKPNEGDRETDWIDIVAWNKSAEFVQKYFHKGDMILVKGRIQTRMYEDKNGQKRKAVEVIGESFNFCGTKKDSAQGGQPAQGGQYGGQLAQGGQYGGQLGGQFAQGGQLTQQYAQGGQIAQQRAPQAQGGQYAQQTLGQNPYDGFMSIPDGIDEELPFM